MELPFAPFLDRALMPTGDFVSDPFAAAAMRTRRSVQPMGGRQEGPASFVLSNYLPHVLSSLMGLPGRAVGAAGELQRTGDVYDPAPALETALTMVGMPGGKGGLGSGARTPIAGLPQPQGIRAYHGSPYDFERFDMSKIGTGEGAQAYGHGLYFAENPKVAQGYKTSLGNWPTTLKELTGMSLSDDAVNALLRGRAANPDNSMRAAQVAQWQSPELRGVSTEHLGNAVKAIDERGHAGRMYEVNINARPEQFLDWDKPLAGQPRAVQELWASQFKPTGGGPQRLDVPVDPSAGAFVPGVEGSKLYNTLATKAGFEASTNNPAGYVSSQLREAGIPGIKYLDQGSRAGGTPTAIERINDGWRVTLKDANGVAVRHKFAGEAAARAFAERQANPTSNYVLFRDDIIDILRKYGLAGGAALPPAIAGFNQSEAVQ